MTAFWKDDFESGDFSAWDDASQGFHNAVVIDGSVNGGPAAARVGTHFYQSEVHSGDSIPAAGSGERCEIIKGSIDAVNGNERWYGWSSWWPAGLPLSNGPTATTVVMGQFHSNADANVNPNMNQANVWLVNAPNLAGANLGYTTANPGMLLGINGGDPNLAGQRLNINTQTGGANGDPYTSLVLDIGAASVYRGAGWVDWALHAIWHDAGQGLVELWRRFPAAASSYTLVASLSNCSTLYKGFSGYYKVGQYRTPTPSGMGIGFAWYDAVAMGFSLADVDPGTGVAPPPVTSRDAGMRAPGGSRVIFPAGRIAGRGGGGI